MSAMFGDRRKFRRAAVVRTSFISIQGSFAMKTHFGFLIASALAAAGAAGTTAASAQDASNDMEAPRALRVLDTNNDGKITLDEIRAEQRRLLGAADLDADGKLSVEEFRRRGRWFQKLNTTTLFDLMDTNGDRVLTADEIAAPSARWFRRYDRDGDGNLVPAEVPQFSDSARHFPDKQ